ncbi:MAG: hypothetical protein WCC36_11075, partial [Gammaproteobacteria bacterium]
VLSELTKIVSVLNETTKKSLNSTTQLDTAAKSAQSNEDRLKNAAEEVTGARQQLEGTIHDLTTDQKRLGATIDELAAWVRQNADASPAPKKEQKQSDVSQNKGDL